MVAKVSQVGFEQVAKDWHAHLSVVPLQSDKN